MNRASTAGDMPVRKPRILRITKATIVEIISSLLILLFMYAAVTKLLDYQTFKLQLNKSPFITKFAGITAWALPAGEILVGLALSFKKTRLLGFYASLLLMTLFSAYIYVMLNYSFYLPCSCGGVLSKMDWNTHFWFNIGFLLLSTIGILLTAGPPNSIKEKVEEQ